MARSTANRIKCGRVHGRVSRHEREYFRRIPSTSGPAPLDFATSYRRRTSCDTPTNTSPPVGSTSRRIPFPVVVLPQPLSPTRQKISPRPTSRSTPSTARTYSGVAFRNASKNPRRFSNQTRKSLRTRYGSRATSRRLLRRRGRGVQVACGEVVRSDRVETGFLVDAQLPGVLAPGMEAAPEGRVDQRRQEARDVRRQGLRALDVRERADQILRVRMLRVLVDVPDAPAFHDLPGIRSEERIARLCHHAEVVRDEDHREVELPLQALEEFE